MILDTLEHAGRYNALHPGFNTAFNFLRRNDLSAIPDGQIELDGDRVFAIIAHAEGRREADGQLEGHKKYIDIQYLLSGVESMGWKSIEGLNVSVEYDAEKDLLLFDGSAESLVRVPPGSFAIFFPEDAHLPLIGDGPIHKVIIKVAV